MRLPVKQDLIFQTTASTFLIWGMPGQVAMASLYAGGSDLFVIFTAVALANLRMMLMSISGADMLGLNETGSALFETTILYPVSGDFGLGTAYLSGSTI